MQNDDFGGLTASAQQKKMYFALMKKLGYTSETAKAILKKRFLLDSFANISTEQLTKVIEKLNKRVNKHVLQHHSN